jgi:hypothetical protein
MTRLIPALALALAVTACSPNEDEASKPAGAPVAGMGIVTAEDFKTDYALKEVMGHAVDFAAFGVWNNQGWLINAEGTHELFPTDDAGWHNAESAAITLAEISNVLLLPGRPQNDDRRWVDAAHQLHDAAMDAQKTAEARDKQAFFDAGGEIYEACVTCHNHFVQGDAAGPAAKLPELPNRVRPGSEPPPKPNQ